MHDSPVRIKRRTFLQGAAGAAVLFAAGCGGEDKSAQQGAEGAAPAVEFKEPSAKLSGDLKILMWSHFVPRHDKWFDPFARDWGKKVGVNVTIDHIDVTGIPARIGSEIKSKQHIQLGVGMSQEIDSNMAARALLWSFGGAEQDENANVTINSPETVAAVEYMTKLYKQAMTQEIFAWNPASNNQGLIGGKLSYILNSISAYRTLQGVNPSVANDVAFVKALKGPKAGFAAQHVMYNYIVPKFAKNPDAAREFLLHYTQNWARTTWESQLYDFPAFPDRVPKLKEWLDSDPFGSKPANKLAVLKDAVDWSHNVGYPGYANAAIGEAFGTFVLPNMPARAARGKQSPKESVATAESQMKPIFEKWRKKGLIGGGA